MAFISEADVEAALLDQGMSRVFVETLHRWRLRAEPLGVLKSRKEA